MDDITRPTDVHPQPGRPCRAVRVVLADDECMFRTSLRHLLAVPPSVVRDVYRVDVGHGFEVVGEASTGEETIETVSSQRPDLLLLDVSMPRLSGLDALRAIGPTVDAMRTIILSGGLDKSQLLTAIQLGARGVVLKDCATELLFEAMTRVMAGLSWVGQPLVDDLLDVIRGLARGTQGGSPRQQPFGLTNREREVLSLVVAGCANKEIAQRFAVSEETIKHHLTRMFDKVGAANRLELAMTATRIGLVN
jgi:two-component system, NarL family, nitrate/nitrite response regulator NarL